MTDATRHELVLTRLIDATPEALYRCWTEPALLKQWFAPQPLTTPVAEMDVRPGGSCHIVMHDPGSRSDYPCDGVYLEVVPNRRLVSTDAYTRAWEPSGKPFMTLTITFEPDGTGTRYTATARHWNAEDKATHESMGFHEGWGRCTDQLTELARSL